MGITHRFNRARAFVHAQSGSDQQQLLSICRSIQQAELALQAHTQPYLRHCRQCGGLCCRRIQVETIVFQSDLIYILALAPQMEKAIRAHLQNQSVMHQSDCPFLAKGVGPCLFPTTVRPFVCIATFCFEAPKAAKSIQQLRRKFWSLNVWVWKQEMGARWQNVKNAIGIKPATPRTD